jgi:major membrane immunogen (membrane-anchored lipoprotein)
LSSNARTGSLKKIRATGHVVAVVFIALVSLAVTGATSTSTTTTVKDGRKITTKVKIDNDGTTTTTVTTKEKDGTATTTTTVTDKAGNIVSTDDPEARARAEMAKKAREDRQAALASAPRRGRYDPIQVAVFQTVVSEDLRKATTKDGVFAYLRKEFDGDAVIKPLDQAQVDRYASNYDFRTGRSKSMSAFDRGAAFLPADVYVESFARMEDKVGISRTTKKLASAPYLVYTAKVVSEYGERSIDVTEEGHILTNVEVTRKFAEKIRLAILEEIGPDIPQDAPRFRRGTQGLAGEQISMPDALRKLFKKK